MNIIIVVLKKLYLCKKKNFKMNIMRIPIQFIFQRKRKKRKKRENTDSTLNVLFKNRKFELDLS